MKPLLTFLFCFALPALFAQDLAPASVAGLLYTAAPNAVSPGQFLPSHAGVLSNDGTLTPIAFGVTAGSTAILRTYTWVKTGANTGTLTLFEPTLASTLEFTFTTAGKGTYREIFQRTGVVLLGNFQLATMPNDPTPPLMNASLRATLATGQAASQGFVVGAGPPRRVLVRAIGPSLVQFGVSNPVANPALTVFRGPTQIAANTGWGGTAELASVFTKVGAFALLATSRDSAVLLTLEPGNYTAHARADTAGEVLLEVYFVD